MTVLELYKWAKKNKATEMNIEIQYRDAGGCYSGTDDCVEPIIQEKSYGKVIIL